MDKLENISVLVILPLVLALLDLLIGNELLIQLELINKSDKQEILLILTGITLIILVVSLRIKIPKLISYLIRLGFAWNIFTSFYGFYELFPIEKQSALSTKFVAFTLAILMTSLSTLIILLSIYLIFGVPKKIAEGLIKQNITKLKENISLKRIYFSLFGLAIFFDFYTSLSANSALLGLKELHTMPIMSLLVLGIGTLLICLCQYIFWILFATE